MHILYKILSIHFWAKMFLKGAKDLRFDKTLSSYPKIEAVFPKEY